MTGELKEWSDGVPDGETHLIDLDLFEACDDINIRACVELLHTLEEKYEYLLNINVISMKEIEAYREKKYSDMISNNGGSDDDESDEKKSTDKDDGLPF